MKYINFVLDTIAIAIVGVAFVSVCYGLWYLSIFFGVSFKEVVFVGLAVIFVLSRWVHWEDYKDEKTFRDYR